MHASADGNISRTPDILSVMDDTRVMLALTIRAAAARDADAIARIFIESAEHHAGLDPERYAVPSAEAIAARYREGRQHDAGEHPASTTLVTEHEGEVVGFVDARLEESSDPMHRPIVYCHVAEIAVSRRHQGNGIGARLLNAAEDWGRRNGASYASLDYHVANARAAAFYQHAMGYGAAAVIAIKRL